jgi:hypothetical protein
MLADEDPIGLFDCHRIAMIKLNMRRRNHTSCQGLLDVVVGYSIAFSFVCSEITSVTVCGFEVMPTG